MSGQQPGEFAVFNRLVVLDADCRVLLVRVAEAGVWVTPGYYQAGAEPTRECLRELAQSYGLEISAPELRGTFWLQRELPRDSSVSLRKVFGARLVSGRDSPASSGDSASPGALRSIGVDLPEGIDSLAWLSPTEAVAQLSFPHIGVMLERVATSPDTLWGGSLAQRQGGAAVVEPYYPLAALRSEAISQRCD